MILFCGAIKVRYAFLAEFNLISMNIDDLAPKKNPTPTSLISSSLIFFIILIGLLSGLAGGVIFSRLYAPYMQNTQNNEVKTIIEQRNYIEESQSISAIEKINPAVVSVIATKDLEIYYRDPFNFFDIGETETRRQEIGGGSAFIISADGMAVTNRHVVDDNRAEYSALSRDGQKFNVKVLVSDSDVDIALIQLYLPSEKQGEENKPENLAVAQFGKSADLKVGQKVLAIGNALGEYDNTVTSGIVSGIGRQIVAGDRMGNTSQLLGLIQTDAAINPGNSGGPLIGLGGDVVGVNVAIDRNGSNIGFAVPIDDVNRVIESYRKFGRIVRPALGVRYIVLTPEKARQLKLPVESGALLVGGESRGEFAVIPGSAADKSGLQIKDIILEVNGKKLTIDYSLRDIVVKSAVGDKLQLKIWRSGQELDKELVLEELPTEP